jgi:hypothetical protein
VKQAANTTAVAMWRLHKQACFHGNNCTQIMERYFLCGPCRDVIIRALSESQLSWVYSHTAYIWQYCSCKYKIWEAFWAMLHICIYIYIYHIGNTCTSLNFRMSCAYLLLLDTFNYAGNMMKWGLTVFMLHTEYVTCRNIHFIGLIYLWCLRLDFCSHVKYVK